MPPRVWAEQAGSQLEGSLVVRLPVPF